MSKGALLFAHNNEEIDYLKIAAVNSLMIQENLKIGVSLVTDEGTYAWALESLGKEKLDQCFENIIVKDRDYVYTQHNIRLFKDTVHHAERLPFYNCDHWMAYDLTPYEETLFVDADYLIMSDALSHCWGSEHDFMMNYKISGCCFGRDSDHEVDYLSEYGIKTYWATAIYFRKTEYTKHIFSIVQHVFDNYSYYRQLYLIPRGLFRNDYAFSIAIHMMNGFTDSGLCKEFPTPVIYKVYDTGDICSINGKNDITMYVNDPNMHGKYFLTRIKDLDLHVMNKWALLRFADELMETYS